MTRRAMFGAVVYWLALAALVHAVAPPLPPIPCGGGNCSACSACR